MSLLSKINVIFIIALGVIFAGMLLHIIGLATPEWTVGEYHERSSTVSKDIYESFGLWKFCSHGACQDFPGATASMRACQAMAILGMLASFVVLAVAIVDIYHKAYDKLPIIPFTTVVAASTLASFVFILIGIIVWGADVNQEQTVIIDNSDTTGTNNQFLYMSSNLGYSFGLSIAGGILILIGGLMYFFNHRRIAG